MMVGSLPSFRKRWDSVRPNLVSLLFSRVISALGKFEGFALNSLQGALDRQHLFAHLSNFVQQDFHGVFFRDGGTLGGHSETTIPSEIFDGRHHGVHSGVRKSPIFYR